MPFFVDVVQGNQAYTLYEFVVAKLLMTYTRAFQREALTAADLAAASKAFFF